MIAVIVRTSEFVNMLVYLNHKIKVKLQSVQIIVRNPLFYTTFAFELEETTTGNLLGYLKAFKKQLLFL